MLSERIFLYIPCMDKNSAGISIKRPFYYFFETYKMYLVNSETYGKLHPFHTYYRSNSPTTLFSYKNGDPICKQKQSRNLKWKKSMKCYQHDNKFIPRSILQNITINIKIQIDMKHNVWRRYCSWYSLRQVIRPSLSPRITLCSV